MLTDQLLQFLLAIVAGIWSLVPAWTITPGSGWEGAVGDFARWNKLAPCTELFAVLAGVVAVFGVTVVLKWVIKVIDWIADVIP